jgi:hypothetical protein
VPLPAWGLRRRCSSRRRGDFRTVSLGARTRAGPFRADALGAKHAGVVVSVLDAHDEVLAREAVSNSCPFLFLLLHSDDDAKLAMAVIARPYQILQPVVEARLFSFAISGFGVVDLLISVALKIVPPNGHDDGFPARTFRRPAPPRIGSFCSSEMSKARLERPSSARRHRAIWQHPT